MKLLTFEADGQEQWGVLLVDPDGGSKYALVPSKLQRLLPSICSATSAFLLNAPRMMPENRWPETLAGLLGMEEEGIRILREAYDFARGYLFLQDRYLLNACAYPLDRIKSGRRFRSRDSTGGWCRTPRPSPAISPAGSTRTFIPRAISGRRPVLSARGKKSIFTRRRGS